MSSYDKDKNFCKINARVNTQFKEEALAIIHALGLNMSIAINVFLRQICLKGRIPFSISLDNSEGKIDEEILKNWEDFPDWGLGNAGRPKLVKDNETIEKELESEVADILKNDSSLIKERSIRG